MRKERGSISVAVLLTMSFLIFLWSGLINLTFYQHLAVIEEKTQTIVLYGAERGAVWAMKYLRLKGIDAQGSYVLPEDGQISTVVRIKQRKDKSIEVVSEGKQINGNDRLRLVIILLFDPSSKQFEIKAMYPAV